MSLTAQFHGLGEAHDERSGDVAAQVRAELVRIGAALAAVGRGMRELLELRVFVVQDAADEAQIAALVARDLPDERPVLTVVRVHELGLGGLIGIEAISVPPVMGADRVAASAGEKHGFPTALRLGLFVAARATPNVVGDLVATTHVGIAELAAGLASVGSGPRDIVKYNIFYRGDGTSADWAFSSRARAEIFTGPGPATTGIPVPELADPAAHIQFSMFGKVGSRTQNGAATVRPDGHWDWPVPLPHFHGNRVQELGFVGGQVALAEDASVLFPDDHRAQTRRSMAYIETILRDLGRELSDLVRLTAFYEVGSAETPEAVRSEIVAALPPGSAPELSLVGLHKLAYEHMVVEIECQFERGA